MPNTIDHFTLERSPDQSAWTMLNSNIPGSARSYDDAASPAPSDFYRLTGYTSDGFSFPYNIVQVINSSFAGAFQWVRVPTSPGNARGFNCATHAATGDVVLAATNGGNYGFLGRFDKSGVLLWSQSFFSPMEIHGVCFDPSNNVIITGKYLGSANFGGGSLPGSLNSWGMFVAKFDGSGAYVWQKGYQPGISNSTNVGNSAACDAGGNVLLTGSFRAIDFGGGVMTSAGSSTEIFLAKLNPAGDYVWQHSYGIGSGNAVGADASGNVWIAGWCGFSANFGGGAVGGATATAFLAKFTAGGGYGGYAKSFGLAGSGFSEVKALAISPSPSTLNEVAVTGSFLGTANFGGANMSANASSQADTFFARVNSAGTHIWSKHMTSSSATSGIGYGAAMDPAGNMIFTGLMAGTEDFGGGSVNGNLFAVKYSAGGAWVWNYTAGGSFTPGGLAATTDSLFLCGMWQDTVNFGDGPRTSSVQQYYLLRFG